jgi:hypothetical protein
VAKLPVCRRWGLASIKRIIKRERVSCNPSKNPKCRFSKEKEKTSDKGKCGSNVGLDSRILGCVGRGRVFRGRREDGRPSEKKSFGLGVGPTFVRFW